VHPITALQSEYSLWTRDGDDGTLALLRELGIGFVPYSPLNRGLLAGVIRSRDDLEETDWRLTNPRFVAGAFERNLAVVDDVAAIGEEIGATPAQVSLAWLLAQEDDWSPIPGTVRIDHLEEDLGALELTLSADQMQRLTDITPAIGDHHTAPQLALFDR
jgi:aryl-alcohol dehydrogenase-like predicted oxidoreductase